MTKQKNKQGRPTVYDPDFHPQDFIARSKNGETLTEIASKWDLHKDTLYEWRKKHKPFADAVEKGRLHIESWFIKLGKAKMAGQVKGSDIIYIWLTKNILGWRDRIELDGEGDFESLEFVE